MHSQCHQNLFFPTIRTYLEGRPRTQEIEMSTARSWNDVKRLLVILAIAVAAMVLVFTTPAHAHSTRAYEAT